MAKLEAAGLRKVYPGGRGGEVEALRGLDLEVGEGELMVLVGPSGCGKSTTLRLLAGLEEATAGTVSIGGVSVDGLPPRDRDVAMVFQNYALYPHLTAYGNMAFGLRLRKVPRAEVEARVQEAAGALGITGCLGRRPAELSGGQRQRVALGRAMVRRPAVFLFDEPLSNLDAPMRVAMRAEIAKLHRRLGATMIYVTHDQVEAMTLGDRLTVMEGGAVQQVAPPLEVYHRPANRFVAGFIGSPPMNFLTGTVAAGGGGAGARFTPSGGAAAGGFDLAATAPAGEVVIGLRPEHLRVGDGAGAERGIAAVVEVVETTGAETFLHLDAGGGGTLVARVLPGLAPAPGAAVTVGCDPGQAVFFDPATGLALT